jgi:RNA polymerase sigma-70 factor (ECF subfamily)
MDVEDLVETWRGPLTGLIAVWGASFPDAAELAQDTLAEAYVSRARLRGDPRDPRVAGPWLRGIARNLHAAWMRKRDRTRELGAAHEPAQAPAREIEDERLADLRRAIVRLPRKEREVVYLHYLEETSVRTVAAMLGASEKAVEGRLQRARALLRGMLVESGADTKTRGRTA